ncbi:hypothetical protein L7F22_063140 [Adiantum nelumboides]|nr:hypothetical protein [Adiantum nelumboides]
MLIKLAELIEENIDEIAAIESLDNGKAFSIAKGFDITEVAGCMRYYGGWADKNHGKTVEVDPGKLHLIRHEPVGVCGQIIPWNFPALMFRLEARPALATGNVVVLKTAEQTPLSALKICELIVKAGFPPGVVSMCCLALDPCWRQQLPTTWTLTRSPLPAPQLVGRNIIEGGCFYEPQEGYT